MRRPLILNGLAPLLLQCLSKASCFKGTQQRFFRTTPHILGLQQLEDMPISTPRRAKNPHLGRFKQRINEGEKEQWRFIKKWELSMLNQWDDLEPFRTQPKPKKLFGNEACEIVWPYALLLENVIKVHRFTKSIYCYYPMYQQTWQGALSAAVARRFSREFLIPITFHNQQVYVETEMLLEYGDTPWIVVNCIDGSQKIISVKYDCKGAAQDSPAFSQVEPSFERAAQKFSLEISGAKKDLLQRVVATCALLGDAVSNVREANTLMHERPPQNQYLRINYQWYGDTVEERMTHLVQWQWTENDVMPRSSSGVPYESRVLDFLNAQGSYPNATTLSNAFLTEKRKVMRMRVATGRSGFVSGQQKRQNARFAKGIGLNSQVI